LEGSAIAVAQLAAIQVSASQAPTVASLTTGDRPLVSAIIATYNRAGLVGNAISSILAQTYSNIEIIVVDDGSTDETQTVLRQFGDRLRVIRQNNAGPGAARNRGIEAAKGQMVAFLDSDDLWTPMKIERQVKVLQMLGESVPCCVCDAEMRFTNRPMRSAFQYFLLNPAQDNGLWLNASRVLIDRFILFNQMAMIRRGAIEKVGGFNEQLRFLEDYDLALRLSLLGPFGFVRQPLVIWNQGSAGSLSKEAHEQMRRLKGFEVEIRERFLESLNITPNHQNLKAKAANALLKARRQLRIANLRQSNSWRLAALGFISSKVEHYVDAAIRRSPWFVKMKIVPLPSIPPKSGTI
jgi:glycosyltransferase involved in cell wall biosynthesis